MERGTLRLLVVTDRAQPDVVQQAIRAADAGWALAAVPTLPAALQWLAQHTADAVLLDAAALGSQSTAAIAQLRTHAPEVALLLIGAHDDDAAALAALRAGAQEYLTSQQLDSGGLRRTLLHAVERARTAAANRRLDADGDSLFHAFMNNSPAIAFMKDEGGRYVYVNELFEHLFQLSAAEVYARTDFDLWPLAIAQQLAANDRMALSTNRALGALETIPGPEGVLRHWLVFKFPIAGTTGQRLLAGMAIDITDRRQVEEELRTLNRELERRVQERTAELARSNAELEQFASVVSHDLQEPLRMVTSYTALLAKRYHGQLDADADEFIGYVVDGVARMRQLITDLLAYSRVNARGQQMTATGCESVLTRALENLAVAVAESNAQVSHDPLPTLDADATQLVQLFQNLIGNAIKFRSEQPPVIHISATLQDHHWLFAVRDNGIGISPQYGERIFEIFQRLHTRERYPGTGIGLAICKKIVERHGGRIWVESQLGSGSTFYFTLLERQALAARDAA